MLSPKLFILFLNVRFIESDLFQYSLFADDTTLYCSRENMEQHLNEDFTNWGSGLIPIDDFIIFSNWWIKNYIDLMIYDVMIERVYVNK